MNSTVALWISFVFTVMFIIFMSGRIIKSIFSHEKATDGIVFSLDNFRYTTMFLSFVLTEYFGILAGEHLLKEYELTTTLLVFAYIVVFASAVLVSAVISSTLVHAERAIVQSSLSFKQRVTVMVIYGLTAGIDFATIYGGFSLVANYLEQNRVVAIKKDINKRDLFLVEQKKKLYKQKEEELSDLDKLLDNPSLIKVQLNSRAKKLKRELEWCKRKHKVCSTTKKFFDSEVLELKKIKAKVLEAKRDLLFKEAQKSLDEYERVSNKIASSKDKKFMSARETKQTIQRFGLVFAFGLVFFNVIASIARSFLKEDSQEHHDEDIEEEIETLKKKSEPITYTETHTNITPVTTLSLRETESLVRDAMKEYMRDINYYISKQDDISKLSLNFSRDKIRAKMQEILDREKTNMTFKIGNPKLMSMIKRFTSEVTAWVQENSWSWQKDEELEVA